MILILVLFLSACNEQKETSCFSFDQRQCQGDEWSNRVFQHNTWDDRLHELETYFIENGVEVINLTIDENHHEFVCEACFFCPEEHRFYLETTIENQKNLSFLNLLNFQEDSCN